jgi:hypothetical protein
VWKKFFESELDDFVCVLGSVFVSVWCFGRCLPHALGAVSCCLECVPAHFNIAFGKLLPH